MAAFEDSKNRCERSFLAPNSDFYEACRNALDRRGWPSSRRCGSFMETKVAPVIDQYWADDAFPFELLPGVEGAQYRRPWSRGVTAVAAAAQKLMGLMAMEMARTDASFLQPFFGRA